MKIYKILLCLIVLASVACDENNEVPVRNQLILIASAETIVLDENRPNEEVLTFTWTDATAISKEYTFSYILRLDVADNNFETAIEPIVAEDGVRSVSFTTNQLYDYIVEKWNGVAGQETQIEARVVAKVNGPTFMYPEIATQKVIVKTFLPKSVPLFLIGTATSAGMDPNNGIMLNELSNGRVYVWVGNLKRGEYKFIYTLGLMLPSLNKGENDTSLIERNYEDEPDNYFTIETDGLYHVYVLRKQMEITTRKVAFENVYLIGNATPAEWNISDAIPLVMDIVNPSIFTAQVALKEGELKLPTRKDWASPTFRPNEADGSITETETKIISASDGPNDTKWKITAEQAGTYKITLDTENKKIYFVKQN